MSIEWLSAESAVDESADLRARRATLEQRIKDAPNDADARVELMRTLDLLGEDATLIHAQAQTALASAPADARAHAWLGYARLQAQDGKGAVESIEHALSIDEHQPLARFARGRIYLAREQFAKALVDFDAGLAGSPDERLCEQLERMKLIALTRMHRYEDAFDIHQRRAASHPDDAQNIIDGADLLELMGRESDARAALDAAVKAQPDSLDLLFHCALRRLERGDHLAAHELCGRILKRDPQHLEAWSMRSQVNFELERYREALNDHDMIRELSKKISPDQSFRAQCMLHLNDMAGAISALRAGLDDTQTPTTLRAQYQSMLAKIGAALGGKEGNAAPNDPCFCGSGKKFKKCHGRK